MKGVGLNFVEQTSLNKCWWPKACEPRKCCGANIVEQIFVEHVWSSKHCRTSVVEQSFTNPANVVEQMLSNKGYKPWKYCQTNVVEQKFTNPANNVVERQILVKVILKVFFFVVSSILQKNVIGSWNRQNDDMTSNVDTVKRRLPSLLSLF